MANDPTQVIVGEARLSYAHIFEPQASTDGGKPAYNVSLLIRKDNVKCLEAIKAGIAAAKAAGASVIGTAPIPERNIPIHDADKPNQDGVIKSEANPEYQGCYYMNVKTLRKPGVFTLGPIVNGQRTFTPVTDPETVYSGCYAFAYVRFYAYNRNGRKGIGASLENVIKVKDGEKLGGGAVAPEVAYQGVDFGNYEQPSTDFDDCF